MKPNFLIIGGQKCASSWFDNCLRQHKQIFLPNFKHKKEINFFDKYYDNGYEWYENLFVCGKNYLAVGETSSHYLSNRNVAQRIFKYIPDTKIIVLLRNPIDRAFSHYKMVLLRKGLDFNKYSFKRCYERFPSIIENGMYSQHLDRYLNYFSRDKIKVILFDKIVSNPIEVLKDTFEFLAVRKDYISKINVNMDNERKNKSSIYNYRNLNRLLIYILKKLDERQAYNLAIKVHDFHKIIKKHSQKNHNLTMDVKDKQFLSDIYRDDINKLQYILNKSLDHWLVDKC